ncbi:MAG: MFS transporter [Alphaproteobacteria bacterium]
MPPQDASPARDRLPGRSARFWYLAGMCPYFCALGVQNVVFIWLMTQILHASPSQVGLAQMLSMLPMLTIVLLGGVVADRRELRRYLIVLQVIMALIPFSLAGSIEFGHLSYWGLVLISVSIGVMGAFIVPARDAMLSLVDDGEIQRTVTAMTGLQFASQIAGLALGGSASWLAAQIGSGPSDPMGAVILLMAQGGLILASACFAGKLPETALRPANRGSALANIAEGFFSAMGNITIRPVMLLMFCIGTLFTGVFLVQMPLIVRDLYQGGSAGLALLNISFMGGTTVMVLALRRARPIRRQGRAMVLASWVSAGVIGLISLSPSFPLMCLLAAVWGGSGGVTMIMSRTLVQGAAPAERRGRILSMFQLAYVGGAPLGSFAMGLLIDAMGVVNAALAPAAGLALVLVVACFTSSIWRLQQ